VSHLSVTGSPSKLPRFQVSSVVAGLLVLIVVLSSSRDTSACECVFPPLEEAFARAEAVFIARVADIRSTGRDQPAALTLAVARAWKGARDGERIVIRREALIMMCYFDFAPGKEYLVYASRAPSGSLDAVPCGRTRLLADASEDLAAFEHLAATAVESGSPSTRALAPDGSPGAAGEAPSSSPALSREPAAGSVPDAQAPRGGGCAACTMASSRGGEPWKNELTVGMLALAFLVGMLRFRRRGAAGAD
jgi:hypothetical protein